MTKPENKELKVEMQIRGIELLSSSLNYPANTAISNFNFSIRTDTRAEAENKRLFVIVHIEISDDLSVPLGAISVSCIFEFSNFEELIKIEANGILNIPPQLVETLNMLSISTTRGMMFSTFKGTFLHGAILPLIDPKNFETKE